MSECGTGCCFCCYCCCCYGLTALPIPCMDVQHVRATMQDRAGSWENYSALFTLLINDEDGRATTLTGG